VRLTTRELKDGVDDARSVDLRSWKSKKWPVNVELVFFIYLMLKRLT
jgi:hypothetical protein